MEDPTQIYIERAYLEAARSFLPVNFVDSEGNKIKISKLTGWALVSIIYSMSYTAVVAFSTIQLLPYWNNGVLRKKFPEASSFDELITDNRKLGTLKKSLKTLCDCQGKKRISEANSTLWTDLIKVVKDHRNFIIHPKPDQEKFQKFFEDVMSNRTWEFAPGVASKIIGYFYDEPDSARNDWLRENQEFKFPTIEVIKPLS